jgi:hypothetical protein
MGAVWPGHTDYMFVSCPACGKQARISVGRVGWSRYAFRQMLPQPWVLHDKVSGLLAKSCHRNKPHTRIHD